MADATRLPEGIIIEVDTTTVASPVDTIVRDTTDGQLYVSTNAVVPTYTALTGVSVSAEYPGQPEAENFLMTAVPSDGETYTLQVGTNTVQYTFRNAPSLSTEVQIGADAKTTQDSLADAINANQSSVVFASKAYSAGTTPATAPIYVMALAVQTTTASFITQTDGTGGDITIRSPTIFGANKGGQINIPSQPIAQFHVRHTVTASEVADGTIRIFFPSGWEPFSYAVLLYDGGGGKGVNTTTPKAGFDGLVFADPGTFGGLSNLSIDQGTGVVYATSDTLVVWGFLGQS